jgi:hypothetical protein
MEGAVESDVALIKESMEHGTVPEASAPTSDEKHISEARIRRQTWLSRVHKSLSVWSLGRLCQSICQYAQAVVG